MARSIDSSVIFIYNLPYVERRTLCEILDQHDKWEELGGRYMKYDVNTLEKIKQSRIWNQKSPTNELLQLWGTQNHTVLELFILLSKMQHYQAMSVLKPLVDSKYHRLIYEGEENFSKIFANLDGSGPSAPPGTYNSPVNGTAAPSNETGKDMGIEPHNMNKPATSTPVPIKVSLPPLESKIQNDSPSKVQPDLLTLQDNKENRLPSETQRKLSNASSVSSSAESCTPFISYAELEAATNHWDRRYILGRGGFGTVFKGMWKNTKVAIKKLESNDAASEELLEAQRQQSLREMKYLNTFRHDNILPLYGYSSGGDAPCLVYQFMENGSLEDRLQCRQGTQPLSWSQRHNIATGIARGLQFLHSLDVKPLIHGDIKSANILLDPRFEPKIGDFGLAREGPTPQCSHFKVSKVHGTRPYLPVELLRGKKLSTKVDTYSFGVVLFEVATGLRAYEESRSQKLLKDYVENYNETVLDELADSKAGPDDARIAPGLLTIGKWCVKQTPSQRPEMVLVHEQLNKMASTIEQAQKAHDLLRQNSLSPSTPYERQLVYDHISQQRRSSVPSSTVGMAPVPVGSISPRPVSPMPIPTVVQSSQPANPFINVTPPSRDRRSQNGSISPNQEQSVINPPLSCESPSITTPCDGELPLISALGVTTPNDSDRNHTSSSSG